MSLIDKLKSIQALRKSLKRAARNSKSIRKTARLTKMSYEIAGSYDALDVFCRISFLEGFLGEPSGKYIGEGNSYAIIQSFLDDYGWAIIGEVSEFNLPETHRASPALEKLIEDVEEADPYLTDGGYAKSPLPYQVRELSRDSSDWDTINKLRASGNNEALLDFFEREKERILHKLKIGGDPAEQMAREVYPEIEDLEYGSFVNEPFIQERWVSPGNTNFYFMVRNKIANVAKSWFRGSFTEAKEFADDVLMATMSGTGLSLDDAEDHVLSKFKVKDKKELFQQEILTPEEFDDLVTEHTVMISDILEDKFFHQQGESLFQSAGYKLLSQKDSVAKVAKKGVSRKASQLAINALKKLQTRYNYHLKAMHGAPGEGMGAGMGERKEDKYPTAQWLVDYTLKDAYYFALAGVFLDEEAVEGVLPKGNTYLDIEAEALKELRQKVHKRWASMIKKGTSKKWVPVLKKNVQLKRDDKIVNKIIIDTLLKHLALSVSVDGLNYNASKVAEATMKELEKKNQELIEETGSGIKIPSMRTLERRLAPGSFTKNYGNQSIKVYKPIVQKTEDDTYAYAEGKVKWDLKYKQVDHPLKNKLYTLEPKFPEDGYSLFAVLAQAAADVMNKNKHLLEEIERSIESNIKNGLGRIRAWPGLGGHKLPKLKEY